MKKRAMKICMFLLFAILLASCASFPKPADANDTLLIIPVDFTTVAAAQWAFYFNLELEGLSKQVSVSPTASHYVAISGLPAGAYTMRRMFLIPMASGYVQGSIEKPYSTPVSTIVTVAGGSTMAPFVLAVTMKEVEPNRFQQSWLFRQVKDSDKDTILKELQQQEGFAAWENHLGE